MRVAITAAAARSALGRTPEEIRAAMLDGRVAVGPVRGFDASGFGDVQAAQIWQEAEAPEDDPALRILGPQGRLLDTLAREVHEEAGLPQLESDGVGLFVAMGMVDSPVYDLVPAVQSARQGADRMEMQSFFGGTYRAIHPLWPLSMLNNVAVGQISIDLDIRGDNLVLASGADAGLRAILEAARSVDSGRCKAAIAAGVSTRVTAQHLARLALQHGGRADSPGEGGAALVLEPEEGARARSAPILGIVRAGATTFQPPRVAGSRAGSDAHRRALALALTLAPVEADGDGVTEGVTSMIQFHGDLAAAAPVMDLSLVLSAWAREPQKGGRPRRALLDAVGREGGFGALVIEEAS